MARMARDYRLETRDARARLPIQADREPYWRQLTPGIFLGYRKGPTGGVWIARVAVKTVGRDTGAAYLKKNLGTADDTADSNSAGILTYSEAFTAVLAFTESCKQLDKPTARYTVADAVKDYMAEHYAKEGQAGYRTEAVMRQIVSALGEKRVADLTAKEINKWLLVFNCINNIINYHDFILIAHGGGRVEDGAGNSLYRGRPEGTGAIEQEPNRRGAQGGTSEACSGVPCWAA